jgi:fatty acid desaturase
MDLSINKTKAIPSLKVSRSMPEPLPEEFKEAVIKDIHEFVAALREKKLFQKLKELQQPSVLRSSSTILFDWIIIFAAWWLSAFVSLYFLPLSILIIGNRQRALGNLLHDAGHSTVDKLKWRNDLIANLSLSWPLFNLTSRYWHLHRTHHLYLGSMSDDPDFIHKDTFWQTTWQKVLSINLFSWPMFRSNAFGQILDVVWKDKIKFISWWLVMLSLLYVITGPTATLIFVGIWMISRATVFHFITTFREISDHVGLVPGTLIGFTRNNPTSSIAKPFFHPHHNGYHLTHHLAQRVPFFALPKAHELFKSCSQYIVGHHCDGYFWGKHTVVDCWTGKCQKEMRAA